MDIKKIEMLELQIEQMREFVIFKLMEKAKRQSLKKISEEIGEHKTSISSFMNGHRTYSTDKIIEIAKKLVVEKY